MNLIILDFCTTNNNRISTVNHYFDISVTENPEYGFLMCNSKLIKLQNRIRIMMNKQRIKLAKLTNSNSHYSDCLSSREIYLLVCAAYLSSNSNIQL